MRFILFLMLLVIHFKAYNQRPEHIIIVTTDGLRWQEVFKGMDTALVNNKVYNEGDSLYLYQKYYDEDKLKSRSKLMPFLWSVIKSTGQIYGNRDFDNHVNVSNPYWFSYPGYSEIMTGYADTLINSNNFPANPHVTVLEFLHKQKGFKNKVSAYGAWYAFDRILNEKRSGIPVISAFDTIGGNNPDATQRLLNQLKQQSYKPWLMDECLDVFTHQAAIYDLKKNQPRVIYIAYGETDEWAHAGKYRSYLDAANQVDNWLRELWQFVQTNPRYKNKTILLVTTDHGRGDAIKSQWTSHGSSIMGSDAIWFAVIGPGIKALGEHKTATQLYQKQFAQTITKLLGLTYVADHPIAEPVEQLFK